MDNPEHEKPRIVIIGMGVSAAYLALLEEVADVTVLDSAADQTAGAEPEQQIPDVTHDIHYVRIDSFRCIESPAQAAPSDYDRRGGKGRGRGRADWNKVNRGY